MSSPRKRRGKMKRKEKDQLESDLDEKIRKLGLSSAKAANVGFKLKRKKKSKRKHNIRTTNKEDVDTLLHAIKTRPKFTNSVEYSLNCLKNLAYDEVATEELIGDGVIEQLVKVMKMNPFNEKIQRAVNGVLASFAKNERLAAMIAERLGSGEKGGLNLLVRSMKKHVEEETLVGTTEAINKLMVHPETINAFSDLKVTAACVHILATNAEVPSVLSGATAVLCSVTSQPEQCPIAIHSGAVPLVVDTIRTYPEDIQAVETSLEFIANIAPYPEAQEMLKELEAVDVLVEAVTHHSYNPKVLQWTTVALSHLTESNDLDRILNTPVAVSELSSGAVARFAALALVPENVQYFFENDGIRWVLQCADVAVSAEVTETSLQMQKNAFLGIARMSDDPQKAYQIMSENGVRTVLQALSSHGTVDTTVAAAVTCLTRLSTTDAKYAEYVAQHCMGPVLNATRVFIEDLDICKSALEFYKTSAAHSSCVGCLIESKAQDHIHQIADEYRTEKDVVQDVLLTLGRMSTSVDNLQQIIDVDGLHTLVEVINEHLEEEAIAFLGLSFLENVALLGEDGLKVLSECDAVNVLTKAAKLHKDHEGIQAVTDSIRDLLAGGQGQEVDAVAMVGDIALKMNGLGPGEMGHLVGQMETAVNLFSNMLVDGQMSDLIQQGAHVALLSSIDALCNLQDTDVDENVYNLCASSATTLLMMSTDATVLQSCVVGGQVSSLLSTALHQVGNVELATSAISLATMSFAAGDLKTLCQPNVIEDFLSLCRTNIVEDDVPMQTLSSIAQICASGDANLISRCVTAGGASLMVDLMRENMANGQLVSGALSVMSQMCTVEGGDIALAECDALTGIIDSLSRHQADAKVFEGALSMLCSLVTNEAAALKCGENGIIPVLVNGVRTHYQSPGIVESDLVFLDSLVSIKDNAKKLKKPALNAQQLIEWAVNSFGQNPVVGANVTTAGQRILATLARKAGRRGKLRKKGKGKSRIQTEEVITVAASVSAASDVRNLNDILVDTESAALVARGGGLQRITDLLANPQDEEMFMEATDAFLSMMDSFEDDEEDFQLTGKIGALCSMMKASETFASMDLTNLTRAVTLCADLEMNENNVNELLAHNPLEALFNIVTLSDDDELLVQAARLLANLCKNEAAMKFVTKLVNLRALIASMRRNIRNQEFLRWCMVLLAQLALNKELQTAIGREGGVQVSCQAMELYTDNQPLIKETLYLLFKLLSKHQVNASFLVSCNGTQQILTVIETYPTELEVLPNAMGILRHLARASDTNKEKIIQNGGASAISDVILNNFNELGLLDICFRTYGNLASSTAHVTEIIASGGVQGLVAGMSVHTDAFGLINNAIKVFSIFARFANEQSMRSLSEEGAVQAIVEAAHTYTDNATLEASCFDCLVNLCKNSKNSEMMIKQDAAKTIINAFESLGYAEELCLKGMQLMKKLVTAKRGLERILSARVGSSLFTVLATHTEGKIARKIQALVLQCFGHLSFGEKAAKQLVEEAPELLATVLSLFAERKAKVKDCFNTIVVLQELSRYHPSAIRMSETALILAGEVFELHHADEKLVRAGLLFVTNLSVAQETHRSIIPTAIVQKILQILKVYGEESEAPQLIEAGCRALETIAFGEQRIRDHLKEQGVLEAMDAILEQYQTRDNVCARARACSDAINREVKLVMMEKKSKMPDILPRKKHRDRQKREQKEITQLPPDVRNFLTSGDLLTKHSNTAKPRSRMVSVSPDLNFFMWRSLQDKTIKKENKMKVVLMKSVDTGRCTPQLQRKRYGRWNVADADFAFAVRGLDITGRERTVDLECKSKEDRDKWVANIEILIKWSDARRKQRQVFSTAGQF